MEITVKLVACKTDREVMLCEQVLRMCRGEESQFKRRDGAWEPVAGETNGFISINMEYRAKPKKELVVPWEFIAEWVCSVEVRGNGTVIAVDDYDNAMRLPLKLDLEGIDLPVAVKRPGVKL